MEAIKPWVSQTIIQYLGTEDEVLISYIFNMLEDKEQVGNVAVAFVFRHDPTSFLFLL